MTTDIESKETPVTSTEGNPGAVTGHTEAVPPETVPAAPPALESIDGVPTTPAPTAVDASLFASKPRGITSKHNPLDIVFLVLRVIIALFTLLAIALISSASFTPTVSRFSPAPHAIEFNEIFYFSYLLTVNVLTCAYTIATIFLSVVLLSTRSFTSHVLVVCHSGMFLLDQALSFLLISAATSAATGIRIERSTLDAYDVTDDFLNKVDASITFTFLAFFALAVVSLSSGYRAIPKISQLLVR